MANLSSNPFGVDLAAIRQDARRSAHAQQARVMLLAAMLTAFGLVAVAATMLTNLI
jgi:hypothetical protein